MFYFEIKIKKNTKNKNFKQYFNEKLKKIRLNIYT